MNVSTTIIDPRVLQGAPSLSPVWGQQLANFSVVKANRRPTSQPRVRIRSKTFTHLAVSTVGSEEQWARNSCAHLRYPATLVVIRSGRLDVRVKVVPSTVTPPLYTGPVAPHIPGRFICMQRSCFCPPSKLSCGRYQYTNNTLPALSARTLPPVRVG